MKKWFKNKRVIIFTTLLTLILFFHAVLNSAYIQRIIIQKVDKIVAGDLHVGKMTFNGILGYFSVEHAEWISEGQKLVLDDAEVSISLWRLLIGRFRLKDVHAKSLHITILQPQKLPESEEPTPKKQIDQVVLKISEIVQRILIDNLQLKTFRIDLPQEQFAVLNDLTFRLNKKLPFLDQNVLLKFSNAHARYKKMEVFMDQFSVIGKYDFKHDDVTQKILPEIKGNLTTHNLLLSIIKTPTPWNAVPEYAPELEPILRKYYPAGIPAERTHFYLSKISLPLEFSNRYYAINKGSIDGFDGNLMVHFLFNKDKGVLDSLIESKKKLKLALLPLGKTKLRSSYNIANLKIKSSGQFKSLTDNKLKGEIKIHLEENLFVSGGPDIIIESKPQMNNGVLNVGPLKAAMGENFVTAAGTISFVDKNYNVNLDTSLIDTQTIIRLFSSMDFIGTAAAHGTIRGALKEPLFDIKIDSSGFKYEALNVGTFDGRLTINKTDLKLLGSTRLGEGTGRADLLVHNVFKSADQKTSFEMGLNNYPLKEIFASDSWSGQLTGDLKISKEKEKLLGSGTVAASNASWLKIPILALKSNISIKDKEVQLAPIQLDFGEDRGSSRVTEPAIIRFNNTLTEFKGSLLKGFQIEGVYDSTKPEKILLNLTSNQVDSRFLEPYFPFPLDEFIQSSKIELEYFFKEPLKSKATGTVSLFNLTTNNKELSLAGSSKMAFQNSTFQMDPTQVRINGRPLSLGGTIAFEGSSNFRIRGDLDLSILDDMQPLFADLESIAKVDIEIMDKITQPSLRGSVVLNKAQFVLRLLPGEIENASGTLTLDKNKIGFRKVTLEYDGAPTSIDGEIGIKEDFTIDSANLGVVARDFPLLKQDTWRLLTDLDIKATGAASQLAVSGNLNIVEGLYFKDYNITNYILKPVGVAQIDELDWPEVIDNMALNLNVRTPGAFEINNNLARLLLRANLKVEGTFEDPILTGDINVTEGEIIALGLDFDNATGFATFSRSNKAVPYIEFKAYRRIQQYDVAAVIKGMMDNLQMDIESTPALNRNDVFSLIAYGRTTDQLRGDRQDIFSRTAVASQLLGLLQRPLSKATQLDIVKLDTDYTRQSVSRNSNDTATSRFSVGKKLSDRLSLAFTTDLSLDEAYKGAVVEYEVFDNFLLKGTKDTGSRYRFDITWRFEID